MLCVISSPGIKAEFSVEFKIDWEELHPKNNKKVKNKVADSNEFFIL